MGDRHTVHWTEIATKLRSKSAIAKTLGNDMLDEYLRMVSEPDGFWQSCAWRPPVEINSLSKGLAGNTRSCALDVLPEYSQRGEIVEQDICVEEDNLKFELPVFFFHSSSGAPGLSIHQIWDWLEKPNLEPSDENTGPISTLLDEDSEITFKSESITCFVAMKACEPMKFNLLFADKTVDLRTLFYQLSSSFLKALTNVWDDSYLQCSREAQRNPYPKLRRVIELTKRLGPRLDALEIFLIGLLPVSDNTYMLLLQWPAAPEVEEVLLCPQSKPFQALQDAAEEGVVESEADSI